MPGVVIDGKEVLVPGLHVRNYLDNPKWKLKIPEDGYVSNRKREDVHGCTVHTTWGIPGGKNQAAQVIHAGKGPTSAKLGADVIARSWTNSSHSGGAILVADYDGGWICTGDLLKTVSYHAGSVNGRTIGIEICQTNPDAELWECQREGLVLMADFLTREFPCLKRAVQNPYNINAIPRLSSGGEWCCGFYGHYHQTRDRGKGDPGEWLLNGLLDANYQPVNFATSSDLDYWKKVQRETLHMEVKDCDGRPGAGTNARLIAAGYPHAQIVHRPGDTHA